MTTDDILGLYFWDTIIQQQQQQLDQISQDYHENNPHHNVIKDDVFLAQPTSIIEYYDDVSSESSSIITSPPTQFLSQPLLDIFGTDIMLPALEPESPQPTLKKRRKKSSEPVLVKKQKRDSQLIEPIITKDDGNKTVFQQLTEQSIDWCRYCGTTEGVNWRPGPWGKRTLCNKHGCDYKGYGLASRLPRLDLSLFTNEKLQDRKRPVIQHFCSTCQSPESDQDNVLVVCEGGCSRAYHQQCHNITVNPAKDDVRWYCTAACKENAKRNKVVVELPRKHIPLMHLLKK